jgi:hypothetical protein
MINDFLNGDYMFWFEALRELTGHSCFKEENRGEIEKQVQEWIKWYKTIEEYKNDTSRNNKEEHIELEFSSGAKAYYKPNPSFQQALKLNVKNLGIDVKFTHVNQPKKFIYIRDFMSHKAGSLVKYDTQLNKYIISKINNMIYNEEEMLLMKEFVKEYIDEKNN